MNENNMSSFYRSSKLYQLLSAPNGEEIYNKIKKIFNTHNKTILLSLLDNNNNVGDFYTLIKDTKKLEEFLEKRNLLKELFDAIISDEEKLILSTTNTNGTPNVFQFFNNGIIKPEDYFKFINTHMLLLETKVLKPDQLEGFGKNEIRLCKIIKDPRFESIKSPNELKEIYVLEIDKSDLTKAEIRKWIKIFSILGFVPTKEEILKIEKFPKFKLIAYKMSKEGKLSFESILELNKKDIYCMYGDLAEILMHKGMEKEKAFNLKNKLLSKNNKNSNSEIKSKDYDFLLKTIFDLEQECVEDILEYSNYEIQKSTIFSIMFSNEKVDIEILKHFFKNHASILLSNNYFNDISKAKENLTGFYSWYKENYNYDIDIVLSNWMLLTNADKKLKLRDLLIVCSTKKYSNVKSLEFAMEAAKCRYPQPNDYSFYENIYLNTKNIPSRYPTDVVFTSDAEGDTPIYVGRFIRRDEPIGMFLGEYVNCCQHPCGAGGNCAIAGQSLPNSGFFAVYDTSKKDRLKNGGIVAVAWVITDEAKGITIFDSFELLDAGNKNRNVYLKDIAVKASNYLIEHCNQNLVIGGSGASDDLFAMKFDEFTPITDRDKFAKIPDNYSRDVNKNPGFKISWIDGCGTMYYDSHRFQVIVAKKKIK